MFADLWSWVEGGEDRCPQTQYFAICTTVFAIPIQRTAAVCFAVFQFCVSGLAHHGKSEEKDVNARIDGAKQREADA